MRALTAAELSQFYTAEPDGSVVRFSCPRCSLVAWVQIDPANSLLEQTLLSHARSHRRRPRAFPLWLNTFDDMEPRVE